jgi:putative redox protein
MDEIFADYRGRGRLDIHIRDHKLTVDQPVADGGVDAGPTPTELFVASLAGCVGYHASRFLQHHLLPTAGLAVTASFEMSADRPQRVASIRIEVHPPPSVPPRQLSALHIVVSNCTVHNSIEQAPSIDIGLAEPLAQAWVAA